MKIKQPRIQSSMNPREGRYNKNKQQMPKNNSKMQINRQDERNTWMLFSLRVATVIIFDNILHLIKNSLDLTWIKFFRLFLEQP